MIHPEDEDEKHGDNRHQGFRKDKQHSLEHTVVHGTQQKQHILHRCGEVAEAKSLYQVCPFLLRGLYCGYPHKGEGKNPQIYHPPVDGRKIITVA
jgi:hypothetical protein